MGSLCCGVTSWHRNTACGVTSRHRDIVTSQHSATMASPWSQPRSPFRPASENEKMFQLTMDDVEANRTIIPMSRGQYSQPSSPMSPASMSRHSSLTSSSIGSSSLHSVSGSGNGTPVKTMKHYEDSLKSVKKENFNLKMKIFFLEERLANGNGASTKALINTNTELKVN